MHLLRMLERWAAPEPHLDRRQQTTIKTTAQATTNPVTVVSSIVESVTNEPPTTQQTQAPTTQQPATTIVKTSDQPQPTTAPQTTQETKTTEQASTPSSQPTTKVQSSQTKQSSVTTVITPTVTDGSAPSTTSIDSFTGTPTSTGKSSGSSGGFDGVKSKDIATGVGVVVGVVGGFAIIVIGIYMWRRHQRRRQMERIGSMEELPRPPSPGPLSRSFTRGHGPRQPIDDDDDDFLTPMDTLPNTHRMDEWGSSKSPPNDTALFDDKSVYAESVYQNDDQEPSLPPLFPVAPPAAVTAANGRYYSGDFSNLPPKTSHGQGLGSGGPNTGAIPTYSAMNKYAAYTPGAAVTTPFGAAVTTNSPTPASASNRMSTSRPGGGYRSYDSHDAGGYV